MDQWEVQLSTWELKGVKVFVIEENITFKFKDPINSR